MLSNVRKSKSWVIRSGVVAQLKRWGRCIGRHRQCLLEPHFFEAALEGIGESIEPEIGSAHSNAENSVMTCEEGAYWRQRQNAANNQS
jgi:hypothetical protein